MKKFFACAPLVVFLVAACNSQRSRPLVNVENHKKEVVHLRFLKPSIDIWTRLAVKQSEGVSVGKNGILIVYENGWVEFESGNKIEAKEGELYFDKESLKVTALNMVVEKDAYFMGRFIRTFE